MAISSDFVHIFYVLRDRGDFHPQTRFPNTKAQSQELSSGLPPEWQTGGHHCHLPAGVRSTTRHRSQVLQLWCVPVTREVSTVMPRECPQELSSIDFCFPNRKFTKREFLYHWIVHFKFNSFPPVASCMLINLIKLKNWDQCGSLAN